MIHFKNDVKLIGRYSMKKKFNDFLIPDISDIIIEYMNETLSLYRNNLIMMKFNLFSNIILPGNSYIEENNQLEYLDTGKEGDNVMKLEWLDNFTHVNLRNYINPESILYCNFKYGITNIIYYKEAEYKITNYVPLAPKLFYIIPISNVFVIKNLEETRITHPYYLKLYNLEIEIKGNFKLKEYFIPSDVIQAILDI